MPGNRRCSWALAVIVSACITQPVIAGDNAPGASSERKAQAAEAVARSAEFAGEVADETADCAGLSYLLEAVPAVDALLGMDEVYRGCESPVTVNLQYEGGALQLTYTLGILDASLADLPQGRAYWQSILDVNRESMRSLMNAQGKLAASGQGRSKRVTLADGSTGVLFREGRDWTLVAMPRNQYALRVDLSGVAAEDAESMLLDAVAALDMDILAK